MLKVKIRTLTPLWTGDIDRECKSIKETGIIGSLRWWYEALVRGLGGYACDPTSDDPRYKKCELKQDKFNKAIKSGKSVQEALDEQICPACQLFGCTGWRKRFRIDIQGLEENDFKDGKGEKAGLRPDKKFSLNIFLLSDIDTKQKWLFQKALWIIEKYGAVGGRTTWKPNGSRGTPYGLIKIEDYGEIKNWGFESGKKEAISWLKRNRENIKRHLGRENNKNWFNFKFYWTLPNNYLNRSEMNKIVNRDESGEYTKSADNFDKWLGGDKGKSKKIFSFGEPEKKVFGYVRSKEEMDKVKEKLQNIGKNISILGTGENIIEEVLR